MTTSRVNEEIQIIEAFQYEAGKLAGFRAARAQAVELLKNEAVKVFLAHNDGAAIFARHLAEKLGEQEEPAEETHTPEEAAVARKWLMEIGMPTTAPEFSAQVDGCKTL